MTQTSSQVFLVLLILIPSVASQTELKCLESERIALMELKQSFEEDQPNHKALLSSWSNEQGKSDCCKWLGIRCDNISGRVVELDLSPSTLRLPRFSALTAKGNINSSLLELRSLTRLDLSDIFFYEIGFPSFVFHFRQLNYLNLSGTFCGGEIPPQFANLSHLEILDLSFSDLTVKKLDWLSRLSSMRELDLSGTNMSNVRDWVQIVNQLPRLKKLVLNTCSLPNIDLSSLTLVNSSRSLSKLSLFNNNLSSDSLYPWLFNVSRRLEVLDLGFNQIEGSIPRAFENSFDNLSFLDLSYNQLGGPILENIGNLSSLEYLDLRNNMFDNEIPESIWKMPRLHTLYVDSNNLTGKIPENLGELSQMETLGLSFNSLQGVITDVHFAKLVNLRHLDLSFNSFVLSLSPQWVPPFDLDAILLGSCYLGPRFPRWLRSQKNYQQLDLSNGGICDTIPRWFWDGLSTELFYLNLSNNFISGTIPNNTLKESPMYPEVDLSSNRMEGPIPASLFNSAALHLTANKFSTINSLCNIADDTYLSLLDISNNELFGEIPNCWSRFLMLNVLNLQDNNLSGEIPSSICSSDALRSLNLARNRFEGNLPRSLKKCKELILIDVGENKLTGKLPIWIGQSLKDLVILILRANQFHGNVPLSLCHLNNLQILDWSSNKISGFIPNCITNFTAMKMVGSVESTVSHLYISHGSPTLGTASGGYYDDQLVLTWKRSKARYKSTLKLVKSIDLSNNMLTGLVPNEITHLVGMVSLNLSWNNLSGNIPLNIGQLKSLDSLDLSNNHFSGGIPSSLSLVDRLSLLDLSNNNFSGKIPTGTQLQSFDETAYMGNPELCGDPLPRTCHEQESDRRSRETDVSKAGDEQDRFITPGFYISLGLGYVAGIWGLLGVLLFKKSVRYSYVKLLDKARDWTLLIALTLKMKVQRKFISSVHKNVQ